ncbi:MAG: DNA topoisomerase IV subunit A [Mycoplasma sp.]
MEKMNQDILKLPIDEIMSDDFSKYAKYIIQDRALPDIRDGLKPVQRRIIYAMHNLKLFHDQPHKKSARTVGEVIGKYHPHGDLSIYEAMVRMSQDWKNNVALLDMHGNNGSIDGDGAAAMRYTECRLSHFGETMVTNLDKNTVEFINNFDDSETEPTLLPTLLPNLLINGSSGIAAGYATNIPPFNPTEVIDAIITRIDSPNCHLKSITNVMPAPDFPTGGLILNHEGIINAYTNGKGKIILRGEIKELNKKQLVITSIPYETNKANIIRQIDHLKDKYDALKIKEVRDESDKNGINIVIDTEVNRNLVLIKNLIYKETQLQISYNLNLVAIHNQKPVQFSIFTALDAFINHANEVTIKASQYDLAKALKRQEIVNGLIKAVNVIDDIIYIIRHSTNKEIAKQKIQEQLAFSELQAEAIVNLRLYRLTNYDVDSLKKEAEQLVNDIANLKLLIENKQVRDQHIKNQLRSFKKQYSRPRLSILSEEDNKIQISDADTIEDKEVIINVSYDGYLQSFSKQTLASVDYETIKVKSGDLPVSCFYSNQRHKVCLITSLGNCVSFPTYKVEQTKWKDIGSHVNNIVSIAPNEKIIAVFNFPNNVNDKRVLLIATKQGKIKRVSVGSLNITNICKSSTCMKLDDNDTVVSCLILPDEATNYQIACFSKNGNGYIYSLNEVSLLGKNASGIKAMNLANNDSLLGVTLVNPEQKLLIVGDNGMKRLDFNELPTLKRPSLGKSIFANTKSNRAELLSVYSVNSTDMIQYVNQDLNLAYIKASEIPISDRNARLSKIINGSFSLVNIMNVTNNISSSLTWPTTSIEQNNNKEELKQTSLFDNEKN